MTIRKRRTPTPGFRMPPPFQPLTGEQAALSVRGPLPVCAMMQVLEEFDDYLMCRGYDPEVRLFLNEVPVAKPLNLQKTPWNGKTYTIDGTEVGFTYDGTEARTLDYDDTARSVEVLSYPYFVGDMLACVKPVTKLGQTPGIPDQSGYTEDIDILEMSATLMYDDAGVEIVQWLDLNVAGRGWHTDQQASWIEFTVNDGSGFATTDSSVTVDGVTYHNGRDASPAVTTVYNPAASPSNYMFAGDNNDKGFALYDADDDKYTICQMQPTTQTVVTDYQIVGATSKFQKKTISLTVPFAGTESAWTDVHTGTECP